MKSSVKIGTRGSNLALYQAELVKSLITNAFPMIIAEIEVIKTSGDMIRRQTANPLETKRVFTREIEEALLRGDVDVAVHSAKDMAAVLPDSLVIGAVLEREDPRDCLISAGHRKLSELPAGACIGTSALRRKRQVLRANPHFRVDELHGNVNTRLSKLDDGLYDAIILAYAGMKRLGLTGHVSEVLAPDVFFPAPGQGAIVVQVDENDTGIREIMEAINHGPSALQLQCERAFLKTLEGGCQLPCGIHLIPDGQSVQAKGILFAADENKWVEAECTGSPENMTELGHDLARALIDNGGREILEKIRKNWGQSQKGHTS